MSYHKGEFEKANKYYSSLFYGDLFLGIVFSVISALCVWKLENLIKAIDKLKAQVGIKKTIKDYGIDEKDFLDRLDEMVEQAFDDQCTGANPRYPLMSEIKQMYLNAYYGK